MNDHVVPIYSIIVGQCTNGDKESLIRTVKDKFDAVSNLTVSFLDAKEKWYDDPIPVALLSFTCVADHEKAKRLEFALKLKYSELALMKASQEDLISDNPPTHSSIAEDIRLYYLHKIKLTPFRRL